MIVHANAGREWSIQKMPEHTIIAPPIEHSGIAAENMRLDPTISIAQVPAPAAPGIAQVPAPAAPVAYTSSGIAVPVSKERVANKTTLLPEVRMERTFQIPVVATIVFVITMIAIFYLGRTVSGYYEPVIVDGTVEFQGRS